MRFGKYELGDLIARGGMAEVFAARLYGAEGFVKAVAIKRIRQAISSDPEFVRLFIAEARLVAQLHHANIVQIHDFDEVDGSYYLAMELIEGRDLRRVLTRAAEGGRRLSPELGLHVIAEVAKGLMAAHERCDDDGRPLGIVHRDLSPHNILVSYEGEVKVTDFGIAKAMTASSGHDTGSDVIRGKVAYMSPEQVTGEAVDQRSDLFSLGLILFELTTGHRRYVSDAEVGLLRQVADAVLPDPASHNAAISPELNALVRRLLAPRPADRFASAREVLQALRAVGGARDRSLELGELMQTLYPEEALVSRRSVGSAFGAPRKQTAQVSWAPEDDEPSTSEPRDPTSLAAAAVTSAPGAWMRRRPWLAAAAAVLLGAGAALLALGRLPWLGYPGTESVWRQTRALGEAHRAAAPGNQAGGRLAMPREAGALEIGSEPPGAVVVVDGLPTGRRTPTRLGVKPGRHRVGVRWEDGLEAEEDRVVQAGERLVLRLVRPSPGAGGGARGGPVPGSVEAAGQARARVGGEASQRRAGPTARSEPPGARNRADSGAPGQAAANRETRPSTRGQGRVLFTCRPWALVALEGKELGQTPVGHALGPGRYRVVFRNDSLGKRRTVAFRLKEGGQPLRVDCDFVAD